MANSYFQFKQFIIHQDRCAMKVTTDACLFGSLLPKSLKETKSVLDIGTGTGLLSLMVAQKSNVKIDAVEIDADAAIQAKENIDASSFADSINIIHIDIKEFKSEKKYDIIFSNPPFYENELKGNSNKKNVAHHSEQLSLSELLLIIKNNLSDQGAFYLLLPYKRIEEIYKLLKEIDLSIKHLTFVRQTIKHEFFRVILCGKLDNNDQSIIDIEEISIKDDKEQYTSQFKSLLKEFYLHL